MICLFENSIEGRTQGRARCFSVYSQVRVRRVACLLCMRRHGRQATPFISLRLLLESFVLRAAHFVRRVFCGLMLSVFRKKSSFTIILFSVILIAGFLLVLISYCFVNHRYMKKTSVGVLSLVILLSAVPALVVFAREDAPAPTAYRANEASLNATSKEDNGDDKAEYKLLGESEENGNATSADRAEEKGNSTSSEASEKKETSEKGGDLHRSEVARFVETLLDVADRDDGIGEEVRTIAREQASSSEKIADAVNQIEQRSGVKTFLIGSDYKNIGAIRSEIAQTENRPSGILDGCDECSSGACVNEG